MDASDVGNDSVIVPDPESRRTAEFPVKSRSQERDTRYRRMQELNRLCVSK